MKMNALFLWIYRIRKYVSLFIFLTSDVLHTNVHNQSIYEHRAITAHWTCVQNNI